MIVCNNLERDAASNDKLFERSADRLALFIQHRNDFGKMAGSRKDLINLGRVRRTGRLWFLRVTQCLDSLERSSEADSVGFR